MLWFNIATLIPVILLALGAVSGGAAALSALGYMTALTYLLDRLVQGAAARRDPSGEFPSGHGLSVFLGLAHLALLALAVYAVGGTGGLAGWERVVLFFAFGLFFGQVSNANAHELIHRAARWPRRLGVLVYVTLLFGHHASAHVLVHHVWVASDHDPNSPRQGEGFFRFWPRAWTGSFMQGLRAETARRARATPPRPKWTHPYIAYVGGGVLCTLIVSAAFGGTGLSAFLGLAAYAQMQLLVSDYVQHYGLERTVGENGKLQAVGPEHSWNAPQFFSSALMLNAPRHSDHHMRPSCNYPALELTRDTMPVLPRSLPVMGVLALFPPLWRRVMDPKLATMRKNTVL